MKKISIWAKHHVWQSRLIIIVIYILLNVIGIFIGQQLKDINVILPQFYFIACILITIALWIWYPERLKTRQTSYAKRKLFDFSLGAVTFLMIIYAGNNWRYLFINSETVQATKIIRSSTDSAINSNSLIKSFILNINNTDVSRLSQRKKINLIKTQIKKIQQQKETTKGEKTALIVLSVFVALILLYGLAGLSCSISCGGSEALAIIVALAGTFLIIFLLVRIIKAITNPRKKTLPVELKE
jgi:protein-S-isoprenylcysteine O-methyltransferase Ste14